MCGYLVGFFGCFTSVIANPCCFWAWASSERVFVAGGSCVQGKLTLRVAGSVGFVGGMSLSVSF